MIKIIDPRDKPDPTAIDTTSHSPHDWSSGLSPFKLGPLSLYGNRSAQIFENAWQFAKLYPEHADSQGEPTAAYWTWAERGWNSQRAYRYPLGRGRRPLCSLWDGQRLDYIAARKQIYLPLYQATVAHTPAYHQLEATYHRNGSITLFDGYDHASLDMTLADVLDCPTRICGHSFMLALMLTYGADFKLTDLERSSPASLPTLLMHPITVVNIKTFQGPSEYIGRPMPGRTGSPLGNPFKVKPWGTVRAQRISTGSLPSLVMERDAKTVGRRLSRTHKAGLNRQDWSIESGVLVCAGNLPRRNNKKRDQLSHSTARCRLKEPSTLTLPKIARTPPHAKDSHQQMLAFCSMSH